MGTFLLVSMMYESREVKSIGQVGSM